MPPATPNLKTVYRLWTLPRSGHTAISKWIASGLERPVVYLDDISSMSNPWETGAWGPERWGFDVVDPQRIRSLIQAPTWFRFSELTKALFGLNRAAYSSRAIVRDIILIRDPYNMFASLLRARLRLGRIECWQWPKELLAWTELAGAALKPPSFLKRPVLISYNRWHRDSDYRASIARILGISPDAKLVKTMARSWGGSSFQDKDEYAEHADEMKTSDRWELITDKAFAAMMRYKPLGELSRKLFPEDPGVMRAVRNFADKNPRALHAELWMGR